MHTSVILFNDSIKNLPNHYEKTISYLPHINLKS